MIQIGEEKMKDIEPVNSYITNLAYNKMPIFRCTISLDEYDAIRLGYDSKEKWKELFESKLISFAKKMAEFAPRAYSTLLIESAPCSMYEINPVVM